MTDKSMPLAILLIAVSGIAMGLAYLVGGDPIDGPDPRVCADTGEIPTDEEIIDAAYGVLMDTLLAETGAEAYAGVAVEAGDEDGSAESSMAPIAYGDLAALKASEPYVRFSSDWHWERYQADKALRQQLYRSGLGYTYTVSIAYRRYADAEKPYAVDGFKLGACANRLGDIYPTSRGFWSESFFEQAKAQPAPAPRAAAPDAPAADAIE